MKFAACFLMLSAAVYSAARAEEPPPVTQPPAAETAAAQAASNAPAAAVATNESTPVKPADAAAAATPAKLDKSQSVNVADTDALIKKMRARGYKPVNRKGILVFCRPEGELGTHFQRERCNTLDELKDAERSGQDYANQLQQQGSPTQFKGDMAPNPHQ
jgi:hypothetical protein